MPKFMPKFMMLVLSCCVALPVRAATLYVDDSNSTSTHDGSAKAPFTTVGAAVAAAQDNDTIKVAAGTYKEDIEIQSKPLKLLGGFAGGSTDEYKAGRAGNFGKVDRATNVTRLEGTGGASVIAVIFSGAITIDGFTITGGNANGPEDNRTRYGGGIYCDDSTPTFTNNIVENNSASRNGGGIHISRAVGNGVVANNVVRDNNASSGGLSVDGGNVAIRDNTVANNHASGNHGGGIYAAGPKLEITGNLVEDNVVETSIGGWGAGILVFGPTTTAHLANNIVRRNSAPRAGSGEFIDDGADVVIENDLIYDNVCPIDGGAGIYVDGADWGSELQKGSKAEIRNVTVANHNCNTTFAAGMYVEYLSKVTVTNSIFQGNSKDFYVETQRKPATLTVSYTRTSDDIKGDGIINDDCLFADPAKGEFYLKSKNGRWDPDVKGWVSDTQHSPCIDRGNPDSNASKEPDPNGSRVNLGAFGGTDQASLTDDGNGTTHPLDNPEAGTRPLPDGGSPTATDDAGSPNATNDAGVSGDTHANGEGGGGSGCSLPPEPAGPGLILMMMMLAWACRKRS